MLTRRTVLKWTVGMSAALFASPQSIARGSLLEIGPAEEPCPAVLNPIMERDPSTKSKNIVICSDGTGNWGGDAHPSNVYQLCDLLDLSDESTQIAAYDAGVGTDVDRSAIEKLKPPKGLYIVPDVLTPIPGVHWLQRQFGLLGGYGLEENLEQLYRYLANNYAKGDNIYLFGFSRGAFTVRVLAGMMSRFGIPKQEDMYLFDYMYEESKVHYEKIKNDEEREKKEQEHIDFKRRHGRNCQVKFLGLWDTVKSYGYLFPQSRAHTRHNKDVLTVRHALSMDEQRKFFEQTNWGGLDKDPDDPTGECKDSIDWQNVKEVWFAGDHSDVGGGHEDGHDGLAQISLQWMLKEAVNACPGHANDTLSLRLRNDDILHCKITPNREMARFKRHNKLEDGAWRFVQDGIPRGEMINCSPVPHKAPYTKWSLPWRHEDRREIQKSKRNKQVLLHRTVQDLYDDAEKQQLLGTVDLPHSDVYKLVE